MVLILYYDDTFEYFATFKVMLPKLSKQIILSVSNNLAFFVMHVILVNSLENHICILASSYLCGEAKV